MRKNARHSSVVDTGLCNELHGRVLKMRGLLFVLFIITLSYIDMTNLRNYTVNVKYYFVAFFD